MNGPTSTSPFLDLRAVGYGGLWGLAILGLGAIARHMVTGGTPLSPETEGLVVLALQGLGSLFGGFAAGRRAAAAGWLHGALAGVALILCIAVIMGVATDLPPLAAILKLAAICSGAGILGGITGVNFSSK